MSGTRFSFVSRSSPQRRAATALVVAGFATALGVATLTGRRESSPNEFASLARRAASAPCSAITWSPPFILRTEDGHPAYIEMPRAVAVRGGIALFGRATAVDPTRRRGAIVLLGEPTKDYAGMLLRPDGGVHPIPLPPGASRFEWPQVVATPDGGADVVWLAATDPERSRAGELWQAHFDGRGGWRSATRLVSAGAPRFEWGQIFETTPARAGGVAHLFAPGSDHSPALVLHLRGGPDGWIAGWDSLPGISAYADLAATGESGLVLVYHGDAAGASSALLTRRSLDGGATWSEPNVVLDRRSLDLDAVQLTSDDGILHLLWAERGEAATVHHATTRDGGRIWKEEERLASRDHFGFQTFRAASDTRGRVHLVGTGSLGDHPAPAHAMWAGGQWQHSAPRQPDDAFTIGVPTVAGLPGGLVLLSWNLRTKAVLLPRHLTAVSIGRPAACAED